MAMPPSPAIVNHPGKSIWVGILCVNVRFTNFSSNHTRPVTFAAMASWYCTCRRLHRLWALCGQQLSWRIATRSGKMPSRLKVVGMVLLLGLIPTFFFGGFGLGTWTEVLLAYLAFSGMLYFAMRWPVLKLKLGHYLSASSNAPQRAPPRRP